MDNKPQLSSFAKDALMLHSIVLEARIISIQSEFDIAKDISSKTPDINRLAEIAALQMDLKVTKGQINIIESWIKQGNLVAPYVLSLEGFK